MPTIYTPTDQFPTGTVTVPANGDSGDAAQASGLWETCLDRALYLKNRLLEVLAGTRSLAALAIDGTGNQTVSPPLGALVTSGVITATGAISSTGGGITAASTVISSVAVAGSSAPTTTVAKGASTNDSPVLGWMVTSGGGTTFGRGMNIHSFTRVTKGQYDIQLGVGLSSANYVCPVVTIAAGGGMFVIPFWAASIVGGRVQVEVTVSDSMTAQDADFSLVVFGG